MQMRKDLILRILLPIILAILLAGSVAGQDTPPPPSAPPATPVLPPEAPPATETKPMEIEEVQRNEQGDPVASLDYPNPTPIMDVLADYGMGTGINISARGKAAEKEVRISGENMTPEQFLSRIADQNQLVWTKSAEGYELWDEETYKLQVLPKRVEQKIFVPVHIKASDFLEAIKNANILTAEIGGATVDPRTNQVIVTDLPEKLAYVQDLQNLIDVPQYTRTFYIRYANMDELVKKIENMKLLSDGGSIQLDLEQHLIIVRDLLPNIQAIESLVEMLDVRQPMRVYRLNSIGSEDEELERIEENLKMLMTQDAYYYIDGNRGLILVRDTPEVHRDIERFLKIFNTPVPQVHIQAELLEVNRNVDLNYGLNVTFSEDLASAVKDGLVSGFGIGGVGESTSPDAPYGLIDYRKEFPITSTGSGGFSLRYLSSRAKAELTAALTDINTRLLLRPNLTVKNRATGSVNVVTNEPIATVVPLGDNTNQFSVAQSSVPSGLIVDITPTITPTGLVEIQLSISNSTAERVDLATGLTSGIETITSVRTNEDSVETIMIIPDGETYVISGLIRQGKADSVNGIPILVKIPYIGPLLFGRKINTDRSRNLLFFITPTIMKTDGMLSSIVSDFGGMDSESLATMDLSQAMLAGSGEDRAATATLGAKSGLEISRRFEAPLPPKADGLPTEILEKLPEVGRNGLKPSTSPAKKDVPNTPEELELMLRDGAGLTDERSARGKDAEEISSYVVRPGPPVSPGTPPAGGQPGAPAPAPPQPQPPAAQPPAPPPAAPTAAPAAVGEKKADEEKPGFMVSPRRR